MPAAELSGTLLLAVCSVVPPWARLVRQEAGSWGVGGSSLAAGPPLPHDGQEAKTQRRAGQVKWAAGGSGRLMTTASPSVAVVASEGRSSPKLPNVFLLITSNSDGACVQAILQLC